MELEELMATNPENLARVQHKQLKKHALDILKKLTHELNSERYDKIEEMTFFSPAGDGHGMDNNCIDFGYGKIDLDIVELTKKLQSLKSQYTQK